MKLKLVSLLTAFALILSLVSVTAFADTPTIEVSAAKGTYETGQIVSVDISIKNNPGFVSVQIPVKYDNTVLELVGVEDKGLVSVNGKNASFIAPASDISESNPFKKAEAIMIWDGSVALNKNCTANGVLATLKFRVLSGVTTGTTTISLANFDSDNFLNFDLDSIAATTKDGTISIKGNCAHVNKTQHAAVAATCNATGNIEYYTCNACGMYFDKHGKQITKADTVIPKNNDHKLNHVLAKAATCKAEGNIEYWECSVCHTKWSDEAHTKVVTKVSTDKVSHNFTKKDTSAAYLKSAANCHAKAVYYYSCTMCGVKGTTTFEYGTVDTMKHDGTLSYKHISGSDKHEVTCNGCHAKLREEACASTKAATCTKKAVCDLCRTEFGSLAKHTLTFVPEVKATCVKDGNVAYYQCSVCKQNFEDQAATKVLTKVTTEKAHDLEKVAAVAATCTKPGTKEHYQCKACGKLFTDAAGKTATTADKLVIPAAHKLARTGAIAATCTTTGNKEYWTCTVCNKHFGDAAGKAEIALADATIPALGHKLTKTEKKDATCTAIGCEAYWTCSQCKGIFADDKGETATTLDKLTIAKKDHTPGDYVTNATEHFKTCTVCGTEIKDSRAKHDFVKDEATGVETCKTCGYATGGTVSEDHKHTADTSKWLRDETNHWHECTDANCTAHVDSEGHKFTTKSETVGKKTITVSTCSVCGYVMRTETTSGGNTSGGSTTPSKDIQSGKTFDAGIALYVGLSLLSVTGGAIVIGKKKEF